MSNMNLLSNDWLNYDITGSCDKDYLTAPGGEDFQQLGEVLEWRWKAQPGCTFHHFTCYNYALAGPRVIQISALRIGEVIMSEANHFWEITMKAKPASDKYLKKRLIAGIMFNNDLKKNIRTIYMHFNQHARFMCRLCDENQQVHAQYIPQVGIFVCHKADSAGEQSISFLLDMNLGQLVHFQNGRQTAIVGSNLRSAGSSFTPVQFKMSYYDEMDNEENNITDNEKIEHNTVKQEYQTQASRIHLQSLKHKCRQKIKSHIQHETDVQKLPIPEKLKHFISYGKSKQHRGGMPLDSRKYYHCARPTSTPTDQKKGN